MKNQFYVERSIMATINTFMKNADCRILTVQEGSCVNERKLNDMLLEIRAEVVEQYHIEITKYNNLTAIVKINNPADMMASTVSVRPSFILNRLPTNTQKMLSE